MEDDYFVISVIKLSKIIDKMEKSNDLTEKINSIILKKSVPIGENYHYKTYINFLNPFLPFLYCRTNGMFFVENGKFKFNKYYSVNMFITTIELNKYCKIILSSYQKKLINNYL